MRWETKRPFLLSTEILGFLSLLKKRHALAPFEALISVRLSRCQGMCGPLSRWSGHLRFSLGSPQGIQTCLYLVRWKTTLNLSHCREIVPSFESGPLGFHSTWDRKHRVPLTSLLLSENSSCACGKFAKIISQRQGISSHLWTILCAWSFHRVAILKLIFI